MIVFSNTTPLLALSCVDALHLLPALFENIRVAESVVKECSAGGPIRIPVLTTLPWIQVMPDQPEPRPALWELDAGERQTLELALSHNADWLSSTKRSDAMLPNISA